MFVAVTSELLDGPAQAIAAAISSGRASAREVTEAALARIETRNAAFGAFTDVTAARALARADAIDAARARGEALGPLAGAPFAVKNLFDVEGLPTRAGSKINRERPPAEGGRDAGRAARERRRDPRRRAQHGRIRLRLHRRERARRPVPQSARSRAHDGRIVRRLGRGGRRRPRSDRAGLGHQRLDPRAELVLRHVRPQADLRAPVARRNLPVRRQPRSSRPVRALRRRSRPRLRRDARPRRGRSGAGGRLLPRQRRRRSTTALRACASLGSAAISPARPTPSAFAAVDAVARGAEGGAGRRTGRSRQGARRGLSHHHGRRRGAAPSPPADPRGRLRPGRARPADRRRDAAGRLGPCRRRSSAAVSGRRRWRSFARSTFCLRRRRPAARRRSARRLSSSTARSCWCRPNIGIFTQPISFIGLPVAAVPVWTERRKAADRRADHRPALARGSCAAVARALERDGVVRAPVAPFA